MMSGSVRTGIRTAILPRRGRPLAKWGLSLLSALLKWLVLEASELDRLLLQPQRLILFFPSYCV